jgi:hypothetical protein
MTLRRQAGETAGILERCSDAALGSKPTKNVVIQKVTIERVGKK